MKIKLLRMGLFVLIAAVAASCCACRSAKKVTAPLEKTQWTLVQMDGHPVVSDDNYYIVLGQEEAGRFGGRGDCNSLMGSYEIGKDGRIDLKGIASTRAMCPNQTQESTFFGELEKVDSYMIDGKTLMLISNGELRLVLEAK